MQTAVEEGQPREVDGHQRGEGAIGQSWRCEILIGCDIREHGYNGKHASAHGAGCLMAEPFAANSQKKEREER